MVRRRPPQPGHFAAGRFVISTYDAPVCHAINADILRHRLPLRRQQRRKRSNQHCGDLHCGGVHGHLPALKIHFA
jgi:hypothetical protein